MQQPNLMGLKNPTSCQKALSNHTPTQTTAQEVYCGAKADMVDSGGAAFHDVIKPKLAAPRQACQADCSSNFMLAKTSRLTQPVCTCESAMQVGKWKIDV